MIDRYHACVLATSWMWVAFMRRVCEKASKSLQERHANGMRIIPMWMEELQREGHRTANEASILADIIAQTRLLSCFGTLTKS